MKKLALLSAFLLALSFLAAAPASEPRHPLSQIHPINTALNMSQKSIFNVSEVSLNGGLIFSGEEIQNPSSNPILRHVNSGSVLFPSGNLLLDSHNLNLQGGSVTTDTGEVCIGDECD